MRDSEWTPRRPRWYGNAGWTPGLVELAPEIAPEAVDVASAIARPPG
jgi:hypothetical protein